AVILTGTGSIFSAGVDLFRVVDGGSDYVARFFPALARFVLDLFAFPKPFVVAANGHAIAGGCIFTLCADYRLMAAGTARIGVPELLVGVPFPASVLEVIRYAVPPQHLQMLVYSGRTVVPKKPSASASSTKSRTTSPRAPKPSPASSPHCPRGPSSSPNASSATKRSRAPDTTRTSWTARPSSSGRRRKPTRASANTSRRP
ncbi:MAG: enoyl-CoA hydratase/isomerase family protein, partial [Thermoanaerobaculia bacterium]